MNLPVYVDNNATTKIAPEVYEEMKPFLTELYGNPSSMYTFGGQIEKYIVNSREKVADLIGAHSDEVVFTSCGTEGDNAAFWGTLWSYPEKNHVITTRVEHSAVMNTVDFLKTRGYRVTYLDVDSEGMVDPEQLRNSMTDKTAIVSIMYANNETGVIFPIEELGQIVKENGSVFHVDAVQAVGKIPLDLQKLEVIDILTLSGHKLHAPKGVGALYIRRGTHFRPFMIGGHQEKGKRGGTENVASIVGLGKACELAGENIERENTKVRKLRDKLEENLLMNARDAILNGHKTQRLPNTTNISFKYVEGEAILLMLDQKGICASSGSACTSGSLEPSHVLRAMGVPYTAAHGSVRFSLSIYNTAEEIDYILEAVPPIIERLRDISPFGREGKKAVC